MPAPGKRSSPALAAANSVKQALLTPVRRIAAGGLEAGVADLLADGDQSGDQFAQGLALGDLGVGLFQQTCRSFRRLDRFSEHVTI